jgi:hypothetical protein
MPVFLAGVLAAAGLAGCGGGDSAEPPPPTAAVNGPGFTFRAEQRREIARTPRAVSVLPADEGSPELESVTIFPLIKPFRPALWPQAAAELDGVADRLVSSLGGEAVAEPRTVRRGGLRGRLYEIRYEREGVELRQRLTLLLSRRTEYQLLCRWDDAAGEPPGCALLETTFRLR